MAKFFLIVTLLLSSCSAFTTKQSTATVTNGTRAYPAPGLALSTQTAYPAQTEIYLTPTRDANKSFVSGRLLLKGKPVTEGLVYLSQIIKTQDGKDLVVGFDRSSPIRGEVDKSGYFTIANVPPGRYGLVYDLVAESFLLNRPDKDESFLIDVTAGQDLNLGALDYPMLPSRQ